MQTPTEPTVNLDGFREAVGGDESERIELLELYVDQIKTKIPLAQAALKNNLPELVRITHTLTGSTSTCGLDEFATHLRALHTAAKAANQSAAEALFPQVATYATRVQSVIEQELARCKKGVKG
jgi:HPt (histidine-containing phosphotransfer) domain-containing protein